MSAAEARGKADEYVSTEFNMARDMWNVQTVEHADRWVLTYSANGDALGGPVVIGVDKHTGRAHLIEGYQ